MTVESIDLPPEDVLCQLGMGDAERGKAVFKAKMERRFGKGNVPPINGMEKV